MIKIIILGDDYSVRHDDCKALLLEIMPSASTGRKKEDARKLRYRSEQWLLEGRIAVCSVNTLVSCPIYTLAGLHPICFTTFLKHYCDGSKLALWRTIEDYYSYVESFQNVGPGRRKGWSHKLIGQPSVSLRDAIFLLPSSHNERRSCCVRHDALFACFFFNALCKEQYVANVLNPIVLWDGSV